MLFQRRRLLFFGLSGVLVVCALIFFGYERNCYNLVSDRELENVRAKLETLTPEEKADLAYFFDYACLFCQYPYTLLGYKPMSICNYLQDSGDLPDLLRADYQRPRHKNFADSLERGYSILEKYSFLFSKKSHLIIRYHASNSQGMKEVALIDNQRCMKEIENNLDEFSRVLKKSYSPEQIFEILTHPEDESFYKITQNNHLLGILLGFGRNNAYLFSLNKKDKLTSFSNEWPGWPRKWLLPCFICDRTTGETKNLKKRYKMARKFIRWTYFNRNQLEVTLALLEKEQ